MSEKMERAMAYEKEKEKQIKSEQRPLFHLASRIGWMNDPNGFSFYDEKYHLFYQYHPYSTQWGPMHWGHAVSEDLLSWEYLPVALAPDQPYDKDGCFSGSAVTMPDGKQLLVYTGVEREMQEDGITVRDIQRQCIAVGDGASYEKYVGNPVLSEKDLPEGGSRYDFRDPKVWKENGTYYLVVGNCDAERDGQILLYSSVNGKEWKYEKILVKNNKRFGCMWECPDFFELQGKRVLLISPQDMLPEELEFHNGNGTLCMIGSMTEAFDFTEESCHTIDYGIDFYAPQTVLAPDGRRIMIGWMQNWDTIVFREDFLWFGQMSLPRELSIRDGRLIQQPVREIANYYGREVIRQNVCLEDDCQLSGVEGRTIDLTVDLMAVDSEKEYRKFELRFADNGKYFSSISYDPYESVVKIDRKYSGSRRATIHQRRCHVRKNHGKIRIRLILDRYSAEIFINDGEQVLSMTLYTDLKADGIRFKVDGKAMMNVTMHELKEI